MTTPTVPDATLLDLLTPVIVRVLTLTQALRAGGTHQTPAVDVYRDLFAELRRVRNDAGRQGRPEADTFQAIFAVAAWIDESLGRFTAWNQKTTPLTQTLFKSQRPGHEFYDRLQALPRDRHQVREVFVTVLGLGFVGILTGNAAKQAEAHRLRQLHAGALAPPPIPPRSLNDSPLTPQPYEVSDPPPLASPPARSARWGAGIAAVAVLAAAGGGVWWVLEGASAAPERLGGTLLEATVERVVTGLECSEVSAVVTPAGLVELSGYVASADDRDRLFSALGNIDGVGGVDGSVDVYTWPFCEAIGMLRRHTSVGTADPSRPQIRPGQPPDSYEAGDNLALHISASNAFDGYLYVDLIASDGTVLHLLPEQLLPDNIVEAGRTVAIGGDPDTAGPNERLWTIARPLGEKMLLAISTPTPLFDDIRPVQEPAADYFAELEESLAGIARLGGQEILPAAYLFLQTSEPTREPVLDLFDAGTDPDEAPVGSVDQQ